MIRNRCYRTCEFKIKLSALSMRFCDRVDIFKYAVHEVVYVCLGDIVSRDNNSAYCNRLNVLGCAVCILRNCVLAVERRFLDQSCDVLVVKAEDVDLLGCCKGCDGCCRSARYDEGCIDLAVLKSFRTVAERLVCRIDVIFCQAIRLENVKCVEVCAGSCSTDGNVLALEVCNRLKGRING